MSTQSQLNLQDRKKIGILVEYFKDNRNKFESLLEQLISSLRSDDELGKHVHSLKWRVKDPDHLHAKLERKMVRAKSDNQIFDITVENLFEKINDLAGCRILHLYTKQFERIHDCLTRILSEYRYELVEGPVARTWDDESRALFTQMGITTKTSSSLYTSVHYVIAPNRRTRITCEIQVRTLAEELWGEVDHTINYPNQSESLACREQIKVLARVTSSCTRLVDAIFSSHDDYKEFRMKLERETGGAASARGSRKKSAQPRGES
jgi:putative GTP pyrophosphokinase